MKTKSKVIPFGTKEWCKTNLNYISGCMHDCKYCYAKSMAVRFKRKTTNDWQIEEIRPSHLNQVIKKREGRIMFPSSHDITPQHLSESMMFLQKILSAGNEVLLVSKPHLEVIQKICSEFMDYKGQILFRFTIGSNNTETLKFWEPNAPSFEERIIALQYAYNLGFDTSISVEPALDTNTDELIRMLLPFVTDAIWIGIPNRLKMRLKQNGYDEEETLQRANELISMQNLRWVNTLYNEFGSNGKIKWKESLKKVIGIEGPTVTGMDL